jgi:acetyl-CoA carboxylase biotin carboxyl carrier protein
MDLDQLKKILDLVREHGLSEFEIEQEGWRLKVRKDSAAAPAYSPPAPPNLPAAPPAGVGSGPRAPALLGDTDTDLAVVKAPIVGTFYRSPEPGAPSFVEVGATVKKGQVLCIIEAMKLMNEIDSEYDGEVVNAYVENGQPVQYGERLFAIRTK